MISIVQNLRIGTKLAITSALSILLVATMIYLQVSGGAEVRKASDDSARQQAVAQNGARGRGAPSGRRPSRRRSQGVRARHADRYPRCPAPDGTAGPGQGDAIPR